MIPIDTRYSLGFSIYTHMYSSAERAVLKLDLNTEREAADFRLSAREFHREAAARH